MTQARHRAVARAARRCHPFGRGTSKLANHPRSRHVPGQAVRTRPAITLVELMVVLVIMSLLVAAVIPMMAPATQTRRLREGARALNTMIGTAQAEAVGLNRMSGIWFEKMSVETGQAADRGAVMNVYYCEEPPPFSGFADNSAVVLEFGTPWKAYFILNEPANYAYPPGLTIDPIPPGLIRPGDRLVVDGIELLLVSTSASNLTADGYFIQTNVLECQQIHSGGSNQKDWNRRFTYQLPTQSIQTTFPKPYQIRRLPQKSATESLQLPAGIVIDLEGSGDGSEYYGFYHDPLRPFPLDLNSNPIPNDNDDPIIILFAPDGTLARIYRNPSNQNAGLSGLIKYAPQGAIHLLVGRRENVNESMSDQSFTENNKANWMNLESLWVSISPQTGRVVTNENATVAESYYNPMNYDPPLRPIYAPTVFQRLAARQFAESNLSLGGR